MIGIDVIEPLVEWSIENVKRDDPELIKSGKLVIKGIIVSDVQRI